LLACGAQAFGFLGEVWTRRRVAQLIHDEFGVRYHPAHVSRLLKQIGWSPQRPLVRASQRDDAAIASWYAERWPALKKSACTKDELSSL
jgi:transposase